ncbi:EAL domain-containing protein [Mesorhizobium salmacidum]|uniref:EAL domain-containing protein n=1 Tax=Mesorhizobium salmacidum TaxID=3015171 RepID=A0ABU8L5I6_9HYPH
MNAVFVLWAMHDPWLVTIAIFICALSTFAALALIHHAKAAAGYIHLAWIGVAAVAVGSGIWATHFVAMLAYSPGYQTGYGLAQMLLSLASGIICAGIGFWLATRGRTRFDAPAGGGVLGLGIACMDYLGMAALKIGGAIVWNDGLIALSIVAGVSLGALSLLVGLSRASMASRLGGAGILTIAICSMHFTGMMDAGLGNCFSVVTADDATPFNLSLAVAIVSSMILIASLTGLRLDLRDKRRRILEQGRMRGLADAALEGLLVCNGHQIITINTSLSVLVGRERDDVANKGLELFFDEGTIATLLATPDTAIEADLKVVHGGLSVPAELILRNIDYCGTERHLIAVRDLSARKKAERDFLFLTRHDSLTGLSNRADYDRQLADEISRAKHNGHKLALLFVELNRFKHVKDRFGHAAGDALLRRVTQCTKASLTGCSFAARLGGEEFAIVIPNLERREEAGYFAQRLLSAFQASNADNDTPYEITASIGVAVLPDDAADAQGLASSADAALHQAKQGGREGYRLFESAMGVEMRDRRQMEIDLRVAIAHDELRLAYQPQMNIDSGTIGGFEVLVRWHHPIHGDISPAVFIPIAEESGQISQIDAWVLRQACADAVTWKNPMSIAVNVSAIQLQSGTLAELILETLVSTGLSPKRLEIEITETAMVHDLDQALVTLRGVKALGVKIAMDDFGTGYSSLANLRAFPFDKIKIDHSFVGGVDCNEHSAAIVRAVLGLGAALRLPVVAEGVEREEELDFLRTEKCAQAQGYLVSKPTSIAAFDSLTNADQKADGIATTHKTAPTLRLVG